MAMRGYGMLIGLVLAGVVASAGCQNAVPLFPTYHNDIKPIMEAHCVRCHGAGGTKNYDPDIPLINNTMTPVVGDFTTFDGTKLLATVPSPQDPNRSTLQYSIDVLPMPPPPSTALDSYDYDTIVTWIHSPLE
ncbi:MAG TPA: hypothetical protein VHL80_07235 [Polyangia bacterium]|nr:hypothetical protein [Polyangia bacterium]